MLCVLFVSATYLNERPHRRHHGSEWTLAFQDPGKEWALFHLLGFKACKLLPLAFICLAKKDFD